MKREEQAVELFLQKHTCSQSIFIPFCEPGVMKKLDAMKISTIFGSGTCGIGTGLCGTASGALLAISMKHGMSNHDDLEAKAHTYALGQIFLTKFKDRMTACSCEGILGVTVGSSEHNEKFQELRATRCVDAVRAASQILEDVL
ncbi:C-GCAxxG-C-C family protein [Propionivibrio dicarboxylicus]|uniref:C-GCAxxG-C-C family protein n=1 Tax=Propionivibrio dicarboxylicus TaxID=83767 RepID=UPI000B805F8D|nr:C-GCAxxG-C-C family protein [Propionivibrio dicarboxylicus]